MRRNETPPLLPITTALLRCDKALTKRGRVTSFRARYRNFDQYERCMSSPIASPTRTVALAAAMLVLGVVIAVACTGCLSWHAGPMPGEPKNARFVTVENTRVRYIDRGTGPVVVMLHGFASSLDTWRPLLPALQGRHRVIALDLKGFGWTDRPAGDYSPQAQAKLVLAVLAKRGVDRFALVGHSWGSSVALAVALAARERVTKIALYDAWALDEQIPSFFRWARQPAIGEALFALFYDQRATDRMVLAFHDASRLDQPLAEAVDRALQRPGTKRAALAAVRGHTFATMQSRYRLLEMPVLLLWGADDRVAMPHHGRRLQRMLPHAQLRTYAQCGHFPMIEAKDASTADLVAFLAEGGVAR